MYKRSKRVSAGTALIVVLLICTAGFLFMIPFSHFSYNVLGVEIERGRPEKIDHHYFFCRWPGDGSFRIGMTTSYYGHDEKEIELVDLAGRFNETPKHDTMRNDAEFLGFSLMADAANESSRKKMSSYWFGMPSWAPALMCLCLCAALIEHRKRKRMSEESAAVPAGDAEAASDSKQTNRSQHDVDTHGNAPASHARERLAGEK